MKTFIALCAFFLCQALNLFGVANYQLVDLGLKDHSSSHVTSINEKGYICGHLLDGTTRSIFVLDPEKKIALRKEKLKSYRLTINNQNEVYGSIIVRITDDVWECDHERIIQWTNPFKYFQYFYFNSLGCPPGQCAEAFKFKSNVVWDANDLGQMIVMNKYTVNDALSTSLIQKTLFWFYDKNEYHSIKNPKLELAFKVNNHSQILGFYRTYDRFNKILKEYTTVYNWNDQSTRVLDIPGSSLGNDINDNGQVVGICYNVKNKEWMGFLADPNGELTYIQHFNPKAINNKGQIIGHYMDNEKKDQPALWENGNLYDLKDLVGLTDDKGDVWDQLDYGVDINDAGWIVGNGTFKGNPQGFVLKPVE